MKYIYKYHNLIDFIINIKLLAAFKILIYINYIDISIKK